VVAIVAVIALVALVSALVVAAVESHGKSTAKTLPPGAVVTLRPVTTPAAAALLTKHLAAVGVPITVTTQPASPAMVGTWISEGATGDVPTPLFSNVQRQAEGYTATLRIPAHFTGRITLEVGVAPGPGQKIEVAGLRNALAPGMPLGCHSLSGAAPADASHVLSELGFTVDVWTTRDPTAASSAPGALTLAQATRLPHLRVAQAYVHDWTGSDLTATRPGIQHHLIVKLADDLLPTYIPQLWTGYSAGLRTTTPPALAGC
jgi:hypothetical protein